eukprot:scaffold18185_cov16-Tisochrysis_lutea.AAC.1
MALSAARSGEEMWNSKYVALLEKWVRQLDWLVLPAHVVNNSAGIFGAARPCTLLSPCLHSRTSMGPQQLTSGPSCPPACIQGHSWILSCSLLDPHVPIHVIKSIIAALPPPFFEQRTCKHVHPRVFTSLPVCSTSSGAQHANTSTQGYGRVTLDEHQAVQQELKTTKQQLADVTPRIKERLGFKGGQAVVTPFYTAGGPAAQRWPACSWLQNALESVYDRAYPTATCSWRTSCTAHALRWPRRARLPKQPSRGWRGTLKPSARSLRARCRPLHNSRPKRRAAGIAQQADVITKSLSIIQGLN